MGLELPQRSGNVGCNPGFSPSLVDDLWSPECFLSAECELPYVWLSLAMASVSNWKICLGRGKKRKKTLEFCQKLLDIWRSGLHSEDMTTGHTWKTQQ